MPKVLIIDEIPHLEAELRALVDQHIEASYLKKNSIQDAIEFFEEALPSLDLVICSYSGNSFFMVKCLLDLIGNTPCILISSSVTILNNPLLKTYGFLNAISNSGYETAVTKILKELKSSSYFQKYLDSDFIPFSQSALLEAAPIQADIYVKLSADRYIKLWKKSDAMPTQELAIEFSKRNIQEYYLSAEDSREILKKTSATLTTLLDQDHVDRSEGEKVSEDALEIMQDVVTRVGFSPEVQEIAKKVAALVVKMMSDDPDLSKILGRFNANKGKYIASHSLMLAEVACAISTRIGWNSTSTYLKLSLVAIMHDISLKDNKLAKIKNLNDPKMVGTLSQQEIKEIKLHPIQAAEYALQFHEIPADVDSMLRQHHERPNGQGFPRGLHHPQITPLASLFIIAHDLLDQVFFTDEMISIDDFLEKNKEEYSAGTFRKICTAIKQKTVMT